MHSCIAWPGPDPTDISNMVCHPVQSSYSCCKMPRNAHCTKRFATFRHNIIHLQRNIVQLFPKCTLMVAEERKISMVSFGKAVDVVNHAILKQNWQRHFLIICLRSIGIATTFHGTERDQSMKCSWGRRIDGWRRALKNAPSVSVTIVYFDAASFICSCVNNFW